MNYYTTSAHHTATQHLREKGLNSITWEHFTGDFESVINYLKRVSNYIYGEFGIDEWELFSGIFHKDIVKDWKEEYKPTQKELEYITHIEIIDTGSNTAYAEAVTIDKLKLIEYLLHCSIVESLENKK